ncbi:MAG: MtrB/PioB family outer membrane beta-barrel protein, partial [Magnetococcus sp. WYHC-3]
TYTFVLTDLGMNPYTATNLPYSFEQQLWRAKAAYRVGNTANVAVGVDHDSHQRTFQLVNETTELTFWTRIKLPTVASIEPTVKAAHAQRERSGLNAQTYLPVLAQQNPLMRVYNLSDRDRDRLGLRLDATLAEKLGVGAEVEYRQDDYETGILGRTEGDSFSATLDLSYALSQGTQAHAWFTHERQGSDQAGSSTFAAADWILADEATTNSVGAGLEWKPEESPVTFSADMAYSRSSGSMSFQNGDVLPNLVSSGMNLGLGGAYALRPHLELRLDYRFAQYREEDWTRDGMVSTSLLNVLGLASPSIHEEQHLVGLTLRYTLPTGDEESGDDDDDK